MITAEYTTYFKNLAANNHKEWFQGNKKQYEQHVKKPFTQLVESLLEKLSEKDNRIANIKASQTLFRINRDIRFSKDKTPYNIIMKASISAGGKKSEMPGFYLGIDAERVHLGGGLYNLPTANLKKIRSYLLQHCDELNSIAESKSFKETLGEIKGEKAKRIDKEFSEATDRCPYLFHKQFYAMGDIDMNHFLSLDEKGQCDLILQYFDEIAPMNQFLEKALA